MDAFKGRTQTTKGIWMARCTGIEPCTIVMDLEGTDGRERGEGGKDNIPKAFENIPPLQFWEEVLFLYLAELEKWSPTAMFQATRMFSSIFDVKKVERFYKS